MLSAQYLCLCAITYGFTVLYGVQTDRYTSDEQDFFMVARPCYSVIIAIRGRSFDTPQRLREQESVSIK